MAKSELIQSISSLSRKIDALTEELSGLRKKVDRLEELNKSLARRHLEDSKELEKARKEIEFLSVSHRLADSPEAIISARKKVSKLIRTIDSCIRMIKED